MAIDRSLAARMSLLAGDAENLFASILGATPRNACGIPTLPIETIAPMAKLRASDWEIAGQLRCDDDLSLLQYLRRVISAGQNNFFYGFLLRRVAEDALGDFRIGDYLAMVRGTMQPIEWVLNLLAAPDLLNKVQHPIAGWVPGGFFSIYESMTLVSPDGRALGPAARAIGDIVNENNRALTVVGHSLGAVLSVYLTLDLASQVAEPEAVLNAFMIACPQPGKPEFATAFRQKVPRYNVVNWWRDIVPQVPPLPYISLLNGGPAQNVFQMIPATPGIGPLPTDNPGENHNADNYALMLDPADPCAISVTAWRAAYHGR